MKHEEKPRLNLHEKLVNYACQWENFSICIQLKSDEWKVINSDKRYQMIAIKFHGNKFTNNKLKFVFCFPIILLKKSTNLPFFIN